MALPFLLVNWARFMMRLWASRDSVVWTSAGFPFKSVIFFVLPILIVFTVADFTTTSARGEALKFMKGLSGHYTVHVNQQPIADPDEVVSALKGIASYWAHHSHPTTRIRVEILGDHGHLTLELGRDSGNPQEYWVFLSEHRVTSGNEIGRITTSVFDKY
jgi:hypothetical protein